MRTALLASIAAASMAVAAAPAVSAEPTLRYHNLGPLKLGMSVTAARATGWIRTPRGGCPLASQRSVVYVLRGASAPAGLRGFAEFNGGKLTNLSVTAGAHTPLGVRVGMPVSTMIKRYRARGKRVRAVWDGVFQAIFVTVRSPGGTVLVSAIATEKTIRRLAIPFVPVCE